MKIVIDMNLSPDWVKVLVDAGGESVHWSMVGDMRATGDVIMSWARDNGYTVFTRFGFWRFTGIDTGGKPKRDSSPHAGCVPRSFRQKVGKGFAGTSVRFGEGRVVNCG